MRILLVHQNFPGQFKHLAAILGADPACQVVALGDQANLGRKVAQIPGVRLVGYESPRGASPQTHHYIRGLENSIRRGQAALRAALQLRQEGFVPDLVYSHPGWGDTLFFKDIFPNAKHLGFFEFYYRSAGSDVNFDPEFPSQFDDICRVRAKNATNLLTLEASDWGITPTRWQWQQFPELFRSRISIVHDGIDTAIVRPDPAATIRLGRVSQPLTPAAETITFVARNLEPYRGFHVFMRALPELLQRRPAARVVIVGADGVSYGGPLPDNQTYRKKLLAELGSGLDLDRIHFVGQVPYETFLSLLQVSAVHVYLTYPFVLSWSMLEAMAAGCLVIGSATPPVQEVIEDGRNGLLVDFFSPQDIIRRIGEVLDHPNRMQALRREARRTAVERYDLNTICLPFQRAVIEALIAGRRPPDRVPASRAAAPVTRTPKPGRHHRAGAARR